MNRYRWERDGYRFVVQDAKRGLARDASRPRVLAVCYDADDAERITAALNESAAAK